MEITSDSVQKTLKIASDLAKELKKGDIIALRGQLGAGKTVFVKGLARGLGIKQEIKSPTFVFEKRYPIIVNNQKIIFHHLDLYRGDSINDLLTLGVHLCLIDSRTLSILLRAHLEPFQIQDRASYPMLVDLFL